MYGTRGAAASIYTAMRERGFSTQAWSEHPLHPKRSEGFSDVDMVNFIFTMDLMNFSFWSERSPSERFQVQYRDQRWTGYNSLVACLRRALDDGIAITTPRFWNEPRCSDELLRSVFRSATNEEIPLLDQRISILREAGDILHEVFGDYTSEEDQGIVTSNRDLTPAPTVNGSMAVHEQMISTVDVNGAIAADEAHINGGFAGNGAEDVANETPEVAEITDNATMRSGLDRESNEPITSQQSVGVPGILVDLTVVRLIEKADHSAGKLVNLLVKHLPCFRDETRFEGQKVRILKRAQILAADLWAAFQGASYGAFDDIGNLTMFADYRVPQMLNALGALSYSPPLLNRIRSLQIIESGHSWEVQLRGCSIWAVEMIRREIVRAHPEASADVNAVLIDFFLYDLAKEREAADAQPMFPHHRTRSVWY